MTDEQKINLLLAALHAALDDADAMRADGYPDPVWADQARAAVAEVSKLQMNKWPI